jgi:hypothetical protein
MTRTNDEAVLACVLRAVQGHGGTPFGTVPRVR